MNQKATNIEPVDRPDCLGIRAHSRDSRASILYLEEATQ